MERSEGSDPVGQASSGYPRTGSHFYRPHEEDKTMTPTPADSPTPADVLPEDLPRADMSENARIIMGKRYLKKNEEGEAIEEPEEMFWRCLLYTSPSPRDRTRSRMPSS